MSHFNLIIVVDSSANIRLMKLISRSHGTIHIQRKAEAFQSLQSQIPMLSQVNHKIGTSDTSSSSLHDTSRPNVD